MSMKMEIKVTAAVRNQKYHSATSKNRYSKRRLCSIAEPSIIFFLLLSLSGKYGFFRQIILKVFTSFGLILNVNESSKTGTLLSFSSIIFVSNTSVKILSSVIETDVRIFSAS